MHLVDEVARECEDEPDHFPFALGEMVDDILVGASVCTLTDDVQLELGLTVRSAWLDPLDPHP